MTINDFDDRLTPLVEDSEWAEKILDKEDNQFTRRAYIRSLFSMIEGSIWVFKQTLLHTGIHEGHLKNLSIAEYALLSEITYDLKSNGRPKEQTKYLKLPENIRFTFDAIGKYFKIDFDLGVDNSGWNNFLEAQKIRNRITHPKSLESFTISDDELEICKNTNSWYLELLLAFYKGIASNSKSEHA